MTIVACLATLEDIPPEWRHLAPPGLGQIPIDLNWPPPLRGAFEAPPPPSRPPGELDFRPGRLPALKQYARDVTALLENETLGDLGILRAIWNNRATRFWWEEEEEGGVSRKAASAVAHLAAIVPRVLDSLKTAPDQMHKTYSPDTVLPAFLRQALKPAFAVNSGDSATRARKHVLPILRQCLLQQLVKLLLGPPRADYEDADAAEFTSLTPAATLYACLDPLLQLWCPMRLEGAVQTVHAGLWELDTFPAPLGNLQHDVVAVSERAAAGKNRGGARLYNPLGRPAGPRQLLCFRLRDAARAFSSAVAPRRLWLVEQADDEPTPTYIEYWRLILLAPTAMDFYHPDGAGVDDDEAEEEEGGAHYTHAFYVRLDAAMPATLDAATFEVHLARVANRVDSVEMPAIDLSELESNSK